MFAVVADRLESRGFEIQFWVPGRLIDPSVIDELRLLVNKEVAPSRAIRNTPRTGVLTWAGIG